MEYALINKKSVRRSREMKAAQKLAKKYYGRVRGKAPKAKISKVVDITDLSYVDLTGEKVEKDSEKYNGQSYSKNDMLINEAEQKINNKNKFSKDEIIKVCEEHHLTGRSGNGYPVADKLKAYAEQNRKQGVLIVNAVECDPGLVHDAWIYRNKFEEIKQGIQILQEAFQFDKTYLATREPIQHQAQEFEQVRVPNCFPCGYEKEVVKFVLGEELEEGEYPLQRGILVMNLQTVVAIYASTKSPNFEKGTVLSMNAELSNPEKNKENMMQDYKYLTAANLLSGKATVVKTSLGVKARDVLQKVYPQSMDRELYIGGGALNCHKLQDSEQVDQTTNFLAIGEMPDYEAAGRCKGCGACSGNCPKGIKVHKIVQAMEKGNVTAASTFGAERCIGCGACTYGCRAGKDVRATIAQVKNQ